MTPHPPTEPDVPPTSGFGRRVLIVEDEVRLARLLREALQRAGFVVDLAHTGDDGLRLARAGGHDAVVLDIMLPGLSGYRVLEALRTGGHDVPIIMLTAKDGEYDELDALELGADDYVTKPFSTRVLVARMLNVMRRRPSEGLQEAGGLRLDSAGHRAWVDDVEIALSAREFELLAHLLARAGRPVSKQELLDDVWDEPYGDPNLVEACMVGLRRKLGPGHVETVRGVGYRVRVEPL
jgi:DNA-binding response OmpR family regulator